MGKLVISPEKHSIGYTGTTCVSLIISQLKMMLCPYETNVMWQFPVSLCPC